MATHTKVNLRQTSHTELPAMSIRRAISTP